MTSYAIVGVGGVGGFYGIHLARAGADVHFLLRSAARDAQVLQLESPDGRIEVRDGHECALHHDWRELPRVDVVVVAVKATANHEVAPRVADLVRPGGAVLLVQNGIDAEPRYAAAVPDGAEVLGGLAFLASHRAAPTRFVHVDYGALTVGRYLDGYAPAGSSPALQAVTADLKRAGVPVVPADDLLAARWQKLVWNIPFNGLSVLLGARTDELMADPSATALARSLMAEVLSAAAADGRDLPPGLIDQMLDLTRTMRSYAPSMSLDYAHRRALEVDAMYRAPIARAKRAGARMERTGALADALAFLDARNRRTSPATRR
jgi:2-dehydropantoate 2-reductase